MAAFGPRLCTALASRSGWTNLCDAHQDSSEAFSSKIIGDWYSIVSNLTYVDFSIDLFNSFFAIDVRFKVGLS